MGGGRRSPALAPADDGDCSFKRSVKRLEIGMLSAFIKIYTFCRVGMLQSNSSSSTSSEVNVKAFSFNFRRRDPDCRRRGGVFGNSRSSCGAKNSRVCSKGVVRCEKRCPVSSQRALKNSISSRRERRISLSMINLLTSLFSMVYIRQVVISGDLDNPKKHSSR